MKKTKIVCTLGPATDVPGRVERLIRLGMDVARLNFSHGTWAEHLARLDEVRKTAARVGRHIGVIQDIQGPKLRTGTPFGPLGPNGNPLPDGAVSLAAGERVVLVATEDVREAETGDRDKDKAKTMAAFAAGLSDAEMGLTVIPVGYAKLADVLKPGATVYMDDAAVELTVLEDRPPKVVLCRVVTGGQLKAHKGVSLPGVKIELPPLTQKDRDDIALGVRHGVDFVAASFVQSASDVEEVRSLLASCGGRQRVIAKIESAAGVDNIDEIIAAADAVMVARGDLGVGIPPEDVPLVQKLIIKRCNTAGKPVITATQMLDSMITRHRPTRAEATDVANAIFDGTDAVMLSGETAAGQFPEEAVDMMCRICSETESALGYDATLLRRRVESRTSVADAIAYATCQTAADLKAPAIVSATQSGSTARMVAKYRPRAIILAATPDETVARQLALSWGVVPLLVPRSHNIEHMLETVREATRESGLVPDGQTVVVTAGVRAGSPGSTNLLQVRTLA